MIMLHLSAHRLLPIFLLPIFIFIVAFIIIPAHAEDTATYDRITLSVSASEDVTADIIVAILYTQQEGSDSAKLADEVNQRISKAIERSTAIPDIKVQPLNYYTNPIYQKQTITGWRVRQSLRLESRDVVQLSELIGELQEYLVMESVDYALSDDYRQAAESELIARTIESFKQRAQLVTEQLGRPDYRLIELAVNSSGDDGPYRPAMTRMAQTAAVAAPTLATGTQTIRVTINGTIELQVK